MATRFGPVVEGLEVGESHRLIVPQKLALGSSIKGQRQPGLFRVYVPTRDGGKLQLETSAGEIEVLAPDGRPAVDATGKPVKKGGKVEFEVPLGVFGAFGVIVTGSASYEISSKLTIEGFARDRDGSMLVPWNFFSFPFTDVDQSHPAKRWENTFKTEAFKFESASFFQSEIDSGGKKRPGFTGHAVTQEFVDAYNEFLGRDVVKLEECGSWGHGDAAAVASAVFTQPRPQRGLSENDIEWAATEVAMRGFTLDLRFFLGGLGNSSRSHPSHKEVPKPAEKQSLDSDVGAFHEALVRTLKQEGQVAIMDLRAAFDPAEDRSAEVQNHVVYKFTAEVEQAEEDEPGKDEVALAHQLRVKATLFANADAKESSGNPESPQGSGETRELQYVVNCDRKGKIDTQHPGNNAVECTSGKDEHFMPRYIFKIKGLAGSGGPGNPGVEPGQLSSLGCRLRPAFGG